MPFVSQILKSKGTEVWTISGDAHVNDALQLMARKDVGALLVVDQGKPTGIFSERDYARKVILKGTSSLEVKVQEIMESKVCYVGPEQTVEECMALVTEKRLRHLPVLENGKLVGMVSIGDLVKASIFEKDFIISQLSNYIHSG